MDLSEEFDIEDLIPAIVIGAVESVQSQRTPQMTGQAGREYLDQLLSSTPLRIYEVLRMKKESFLDLCEWLETNTDLRSTWRVSIQEQVAMFLWTVNYSASSQQVKERFQHSAEIISR